MALSRRFLILAFMALVLCFMDYKVEAKPKLRDAPGLSRDTIIENHKRRRSQLVKLLAEAKEKVSDHTAGRKLMEDDEFATYSKRVDLYQRKLEKMEEEPDEREIQRLLEREEMRAERYRHREL